MSPLPADWLRPEWPAPAAVRAVVTGRSGGVSTGPYATFNLAMHVGDDPAAVGRNRVTLAALAGLPAAPRWLSQVHGATVVHADAVTDPPAADAAWTTSCGVVCAVLTADCLPVLLCDRKARVVAAVHAGWRGLCAGVIEQSLQPLFAAGVDPGDILAWLGPAISAPAYEVDAPVRDELLSRHPAVTGAFRPTRPGHWTLDLYAVARHILMSQQVGYMGGGEQCTLSDQRWYSHRREAPCGRQAALIWLADAG